MPRKYRKAFREVKVNTEQKYQKPQQSGMLGQLGVCHQEVVWSCLPQIPRYSWYLLFFSFLLFVVWDAVDSTGNKVRRKKLTLLWEGFGKLVEGEPDHGRNRIFVAGY